MRGRRCAASGSRTIRDADGGKDVLDLGEGDERDECEQRRSPWNHQSASRSSAAAVRRQARPRAGLRRRPRRPGDHQRVSHTSGRVLQPHQPRRLEQIAGEADDHQRPEEGPVLAPVLRAVEIRIARRAVGPRIVELGQLHPAAPIHHVERARRAARRRRCRAPARRSDRTRRARSGFRTAARGCRIAG